MLHKNIEQLIYWKIKTAKTEQGFVTIEAIAAMLVGLGFLAFSLQAFVFSVAMKVQAQEKQRANELIQEDIERISQLGNNPNLEDVLPVAVRPSVCNPVATVAPVRTDYENGYGYALWDALIAAVPNNDPALQKTIINKIEADGSITTRGRTVALQRFHVSDNGGSDAPHRTLKVGYQVWFWGPDPGNPAVNTYLTQTNAVPAATDNAIAETYVEVIPDVALLCP